MSFHIFAIIFVTFCISSVLGGFFVLFVQEYFAKKIYSDYDKIRELFYTNHSHSYQEMAGVFEATKKSFIYFYDPVYRKAFMCFMDSNGKELLLIQGE